MKHYRTYRRSNGNFYSHEQESGKQRSLKTKDKIVAKRLVDELNKAIEAPVLAKSQAMATLTAVEPMMGKRRWQDVMDEVSDVPKESTRERRLREYKSPRYNPIRNRLVIDPIRAEFNRLLGNQKPSTNTYLKLLQNFALSNRWLSEPVIDAKRWPKAIKKKKRAVTEDEHNRIVASEQNEERRQYYRMIWELGGSQTDVAKLTRKNVDMENQQISYTRCKTGEFAIIPMTQSLVSLIEELPNQGQLFPGMASITANARASEFHRKCRVLNIEGISLHSYRYAWAQRAYQIGLPERWAKSCLGHSSSAVHLAYAKTDDFCPVALDQFNAESKSIV